MWNSASFHFKESQLKPTGVAKCDFVPLTEDRRQLLATKKFLLTKIDKIISVALEVPTSNCLQLLPSAYCLSNLLWFKSVLPYTLIWRRTSEFTSSHKDNFYKSGALTLNSVFLWRCLLNFPEESVGVHQTFLRQGLCILQRCTKPCKNNHHLPT